MALDRLLPISTTPGAVTGDNYMNAVQEEVTGLWDRAVITLTGVSGTNTITATVTPPLTAGLVNGMMFILKLAATTTSSVTLNGNPVVDGEGNALTSANPLRINGNYLLRWDSGLSSYVVVGFFPAAQVIVGRKFIATQSLGPTSGSADFVNGATLNGRTVILDGTYDSYELLLSNIVPTVDDSEVWFRIGTGGGPTYQTANYQYSTVGSANTVSFSALSASAGQMLMTRASGTQDVGNASGEGFNATLCFDNPAATKYFTVGGRCTWVTGAELLGNCVFSGMYTSVVAVTALRVQFDTGNIAAGNATLFGFNKS